MEILYIIGGLLVVVLAVTLAVILYTYKAANDLYDNADIDSNTNQEVTRVK